MPSSFPLVRFEVFCRRLEAVAPEPLTDGALRAMYAHYSELSSWNHRLSLVGAGTWNLAVERHFGESLCGLVWLPAECDLRVVDVGSGGGFPGLPLLAARPGLQLTLIESRQRKWAFLRTVARRATLPCHCLNARVGRALPEGMPSEFSVILVRAVRLESADWRALFRGAPPARFALAWVGKADPALPDDLTIVDERGLVGAEERRIVKICNKNAIREGR